MSLIFATQLTAVATFALAILALATGIFTRKPALPNSHRSVGAVMAQRQSRRQVRHGSSLPSSCLPPQQPLDDS